MIRTLPLVALCLSGCAGDPCARRAGEVLGVDLLVQSEYLRRQERHVPADTVVVWAEATATCAAEVGLGEPGAAVPFPLLPSPTEPDRFGGWYLWNQAAIRLDVTFRNGTSLCVGADDGCDPIPSARDIAPEGPWMDAWDWYVEVWFPIHPDTGTPDYLYSTTDVRP